MIASALPLLAVIAGIVILGVTGNLFSASPIVIAVQVLAAALSIWARRSFQAGTFRVTAAPGGSSIIRRGPYRLIRHPMYSAVLLFLWSGVVSHRSTLTLTIGIAITSVVVARVIVEERVLRAKYPDYQDYARSTKVLIPYVL